MNWSIQQSKVLSTTEIQEIWKDLDRRSRRSRNSRQNRAIFLLSTVYGLRCSEIRQLRLADVKSSLAKPYIKLRKATTKRRKTREVPLNIDRHAADQLRQWKEERTSMGAGNKDPFVCTLARKPDDFETAAAPGSPAVHLANRRGPGQPLARQSVAGRFKSACRILGPDRLEGISIHSGRHSCASVLLRQGMDLVRVKEILGHSNVSTTSVYLHVIDGDDPKDDYFSGL